MNKHRHPTTVCGKPRFGKIGLMHSIHGLGMLSMFDDGCESLIGLEPME